MYLQGQSALEKKAGLSGKGHGKRHHYSGGDMYEMGGTGMYQMQGRGDAFTETVRGILISVISVIITITTITKLRS